MVEIQMIKQFVYVQIVKLGTQINHQQQHLMLLLYCSFNMLLAVVMVVITIALLDTYVNYMDLQAKLLMAVMYYYTSAMYSIFMNTYYLSLWAVKSRLLMLNNSIRFVQMRKISSSFLTNSCFTEEYLLLPHTNRQYRKMEIQRITNSEI